MKMHWIPEGTRDFVPAQYHIKQNVKDRIEKVFDAFGYDEISTPTLEYYQTYLTGFEQLKEEAMYKLIDSSGSILALRMDMTVPIARFVSNKYKNVKKPLRFRYCADVYKQKAHLGGKQNEVSDCGLELIGLSSEESDLEVIVCAMEVMRSLNKHFTLEIGEVNIFLKTCQKLALSKEEIETLADYIDRKSMLDLANYLETLKLPITYRTFFLKLPWLFGKGDILQEALEYCQDDEVKEILFGLKLLDQQLRSLGYEVSFDFGKIAHLNYYSGIIFEAFMEGSGTSVLSGGRYDHLLEKFGKPAYAIGFSVKLDYVFAVLEEVPLEKPWILYYPKAKTLEALRYAGELRKFHRVQLYPREVETLLLVKEGFV